MTHTNHHSHNTCSYDVLTKRPEETVLSGYTGKREEEAACRAKRCPFVEVFRRFLGSRHARQAGRALGTDRVQSGQREESSAQRWIGDPTGRQAGRAPDVDRVRCGQREETGGQRGISRLVV